MIDLLLPLSFTAGAPSELVAEGLEPGETVVFVLGASVGAGPCPRALGGLCLDLGKPARRLDSVVADDEGRAVATWTPPHADLPLACVQAAVARGPGGVDSVLSDALCAEVVVALDPGGCGLGVCVGGSYVEGGGCPTPVGYSPDALISLLVCGGVLDPCCGLGACVGGSYVDDCVAYDPGDPLSAVVCGGAYADGNGVGRCVGDSWCDDAVCYAPGSDVSTLFCACDDSEELSVGCGPIDCTTGCDDCLCYAPDSPELALACPGGTGAFRRYYTGAAYEHFVSSDRTADRGFLAAGFASADAVVLRLDARGEALWARKEPGTWFAADSEGGLHLVGGLGAVALLDDSGALLWRAALPNPTWIAESVAFASDGGASALATAGGDLYVARWDGLGVPQWAVTLSGPGLEAALDVIELPSGDLFLFASTTSWGAGGRDLLFVRLTATGTLAGAGVVGGAADESSWPLRSRLSLVSDGTVAFATNTTSWSWGGKEALYGTIDPTTLTLGFLWLFGWTGDEFATDLVERPSGGYFLLGEEFTDYDGFFVAEIDASGVPLAGWSWGEDPYKNYMEGGIAPDGSPWIASETHHHPVVGPSHLFYVMKGDPDGRMDHCCEVEPLISPYNFPIATSVVSVTPVVAAAALPAPSASVPSFPSFLAQTLCDVDSTYVCGGPVTSECLCTP